MSSHRIFLYGLEYERSSTPSEGEPSPDSRDVVRDLLSLRRVRAGEGTTPRAASNERDVRH